MKIRPMFAWYDLWIGAFWDAKKRALYLFPVPMFGFRVEFNAPAAPRAHGEKEGGGAWMRR